MGFDAFLCVLVRGCGVGTCLLGGICLCSWMFLLSVRFLGYLRCSFAVAMFSARVKSSASNYRLVRACSDCIIY